MKLTPWMLALAAFLIVALLAVGFVFKKLFAAEPPQQAEVARRNVPMALSDIAPGTKIQGNFVGEGPSDPEKLTPDTVLSVNALIGRIAKNRISAATPVKLSDLYPLGEGPEVSIAPGNRLVSVAVGDNTGIVSGFVRPGNFVDVMMTVDNGVRNGRRTNDSMVIQLFDGVRVYAVNGNNAGLNAANARNEVTLELTPEQQKIMVLAREKGEISLSYNPSGPGNGGLSVTASRSDRILLSEILGIEEADQEEKEPFLTEQYRDGFRTTTYYDEDGRPVKPVRRYSGGSADGITNGGVPLQGSDVGSAGWDSTSTDDAQRNQNLSQRPAVAANGLQ